MRREVQFQAEDFVPAWSSNYSEKKFAIYNTCFLSTKKNAHKLDIDEEILRKDAKSILGNFLVAKLQYGDASTHLKDEIIYGYFPREQEIVFEKVKENGSTIVKAKAYCVISKMYGKEFNDIFSYKNLRNTSVEMTVETKDDDENKVIGFDIYGLTCLGLSTKGSCPDANMKMVRFSEEDADEFFAEVHNNSLTVLKKFVEERKESMAEGKTYKIDKSKGAMSETPWGDVDKTELRNKIMDAKNRATLVKAVYMLVEEGWEEAPSEKLKYPVMEIKGDSVVYNRDGLASALGYAKKENETEVVNKVEAIYKKLGLGKEDDAKMAEIAFAAVDIGDMWGRVFDALHDRYPDGDWGSVYRIDGIYEQDNKKFVIIHRKDEDVKYRLDFSLTEEGLTLSDEIVKVELEIIETDDVKKFAEPEGAEKYTQFEIEGRKAWAKVIKKVQDHEGDGAYVDSIEDNHIIYTKDDVRYRVEADIKVDKDDKSVDADIKWDTVKKDKDQKMSEMTPEEMAEKIGELQKNIEERDNIIMEKNKKMEEMEKKLAELREFKKACMEKDKACAVESIMSEVKDYMNEEQFKILRDEGMACEFSQIDAWSNKVKAVSFEMVKGTNKKKRDDSIMKMSAIINNPSKPSSVWERLRNL